MAKIFVNFVGLQLTYILQLYNAYQGEENPQSSLRWLLLTMLLMLWIKKLVSIHRFV